MSYDRAPFATTRWSLIERLRESSPELVREAQDQLSRIYWPCIFGYVRTRVGGADAAEELTQRFFVEVVLGRQLFTGAERREGVRLRSRIFTALRNFLVDQHRRGEAAKAVLEQVAPPGDQAREEDEFFRDWCRDLVNEALRRCELHYESRGKTGHWSLYHECVIGPRTRLTQRPPMAEAAQRHHFESAAAASAALQTVGRLFQSVLREVIAETVEPDRVEDELAELMRHCAD
jgi:RNA polymerase sigma-70 factor (ECF subfamily)